MALVLTQRRRDAKAQGSRLHAFLFCAQLRAPTNAGVQDKRNQQIILADGRKLGFAEYGDPGGTAVFYFHGWPGSRLEVEAISGVALPPRLRIIAVDRPGYGLSDFQPERTLVAWSQDLSQLAGQLKLEQFAVMGVSGGGPYALACAANTPDRVRAVLLLAGMGPLDFRDATRGMVALNRWMLGLARTAPTLARTLVGFGLEHMRNTDDFLSPYIASRLPSSDKAVLEIPGVKEALIRNWHEAFRTGVEGALLDGGLFAQPWGFRLEDVKAPVRLWHGEADIIVPPAMGRRMAEKIPDCRSTFLPNEGHFSLPIKYVRQILECAQL